MGHSPLITPSAPGFTGQKPPASPILGNVPPSQQDKAAFLFRVLREALASGTHTQEAVFHAIADTARILTGAHGAALAVRTRGIVICRARSGDIAPELGATLSSDSGLSGECLRTAKLLRCDDTQTDPRVDPDVCRNLGIRSVAAVPLRVAGASVGILEAFSSRPNAFADDQISCLKRLAEIAEHAYRQESAAQAAAGAPACATISGSTIAGSTAARTRGIPQPPAPASALPGRVSSAAIRKAKSASALSTGSTRNVTRHYWIIAAAVALALFSAVVWGSWRETADESAYSQTAQKTNIAPIEASARSTPLTSLKSSPAFRNERSDKSRANSVVRNVADLEPVGSSPHSPAAAEKNTASVLPSSPDSAHESALEAPEPPPTIAVVTPESNNLANVVSSPAALPTLDVRISQGVTEANLIRKVVPVYPPGALAAKLQGSVTVSASVSEEGAVSAVKVLSGPSILASSAVAAVRQWRYSPTFLNGKPTAIRREITIVFKLP